VLQNGDENLAKDIAMHITAMKPRFLDKNEISADDIEIAKSVFAEEVEGKPEEMKEKILEGKLNAYFKEFTLLDQVFIKDPSKTIDQLLKERGAGIALYEHVMI
jgi:elongation factor Ts